MEAAKLVEVHPEVIEKLNEFFKVEFKEIDKHLNSDVIQTATKEGHWLIPLVDIKPGKPTIPSPEEADTAFKLNDPGLVSLDYQKVPVNAVVVRYRLDYDTAAFASKSRVAFRTIVGPLVRDMVEELREIKGFQETSYSYGDYYGRFARPEAEDVVFKDTDSGGGIEIRLISNSSRLANNK